MNMDFKKNNLSNALSPYLRQHADNPVWWQEWSSQTLAYAQEQKKPLFVSVGYSTCHWCHVMAHESFSNNGVADVLNRDFVCIKVDREERPDLDSFLMNYLVTIQGSGGWPLNVFLTSDLRPIFALTYASLEPHPQMPSFLQIVEKIKAFYDAGSESVAPFVMTMPNAIESAQSDLVAQCHQRFDAVHGGFGHNHKFPPHGTLLFLLYYSSFDKDPRIGIMIEHTLDAMITRGLFDHLQGGFYRYCVDREWTLPHFEKMLYDQAMGLWALCLGYQSLKKPEYRVAALKTVRALDETFAIGDLYLAAHDADTGHEEGGTYLWSYDEIKDILSAEEFERFSKVYLLHPEGMIEGKNHLIKGLPEFLEASEEHLLRARKGRAQPFSDGKLITSWNALTGCALVQAHRYLNLPGAMDKAQKIGRSILDKHFDGKCLTRCSLDGELSSGTYLEDAASLLLLYTFIYEETGQDAEIMNVLYAYLERFRTESGWMESLTEDFQQVPAGSFDHPIPSSVSLAQWACSRANILMKVPMLPAAFWPAFDHDAYNISVMIKNGLFHVMTAPELRDWSDVPLNTIQVQGDRREDCFAGACRAI